MQLAVDVRLAQFSCQRIWIFEVVQAEGVSILEECVPIVCAEQARLCFACRVYNEAVVIEIIRWTKEVAYLSALDVLVPTPSLPGLASVYVCQDAFVLVDMLQVVHLGVCG